MVIYTAVGGVIRTVHVTIHQSISSTILGMFEKSKQ